MPPKAPETLVLRRPRMRLSKRDQYLLFGFLAVVVILAGWLIFAAIGDRVVDWAALVGKLRGMAGVDHVIEVLASAAAGWYVMRSMRYERLILDASGIRYQSPLPAALARVQPSWSHPWSQIRSAEVGVPRHVSSNLVFVVLDAVTAKRKIAGSWVPEGAAVDTPRRSFSLGWRRPSGEAVLRDVEQSALVAYMRRMGVQVAVRPQVHNAFALESNPVALAAAVAVPVLFAYAVADFAINTESYAARPPYELIAGGGILAFFVAAVVLARFRVPGAETVALALLLGVFVSAALYPGLLRLNQLTDTEGLRAHEYRQKGWGLWEPADPALPLLAFTDFYEYWSQFKPGARKEFLLRKGGLGFYQVEMDPINGEMRAFYRKNP